MMMNQMVITLSKTRFLRFYLYFRRAHSIYFVYVIQFVNFVTITYTLLLVELLHFPNIFTYFILYVILFVLTYVPLCIFIGWLDYRKGLVPIETSLAWRVNPVTRDLLKALYYIANNEREKAIEILRKYVEKM